jgi:hypothetical protein
MFQPTDEVIKVKKASTNLLKRVTVCNKNEYRKLDGYLKFLNLDKKQKWKTIKAEENNFERKYKKFQLDVSKVKTNLSRNEIKDLSLVTLPPRSATATIRSTTKSASSNHLAKKSAAPTQLTKLTINTINTYKLSEKINEVARTNQVIFIDDLIQEDSDAKNSDYTDKILFKQNNSNFSYANYCLDRLNTFDSLKSIQAIKPYSAKTKIVNESVNPPHQEEEEEEEEEKKDDHISVSLPSITTIKSNFQAKNLDNFYSTNTDNDFEESTYFQNLIHRRFVFKSKAKQLNKNRFSCHLN